MSTCTVITDDDSGARLVVGIPIPVGTGEANTIVDAGQNAHESLVADPAKVAEALQVRGLRAGDGITITENATDEVLEIINAAGSNPGDVVGPASSTANAAVQFDGTTGKLIKDPDAAYDMGGQEVTNVGDVDGRDVSADGAAADAHIANTSNPHSTTAVQVGADPTGSAAAVQVNLTAHEADLANPHVVTAVQAGADPIGTASTAVTSHESTYNHATLPTVAQKAALAGTGTPAGGNPYVNDDDSRLSDSRTPTGAASGDLAGTYPSPTIPHILVTTNPHSVTAGQVGAIPTAEKGAANGVAELDAGTTVPVAQLPDRAKSRVFLPANAAARLALSALEGDEAEQQDDNSQWLYDGSSWIQRALAGGDVAGPGSAGDNEIVAFDGTTGKVVQRPNASLSANGQSIISVNLVDGRDLSVDGAKLDGIEANAKDDQTISAGVGLSGGGLGDVSLAADFGIASGKVTEGDDSRILTQAENDAAQGTDGSPSAANRFVTDSDSRLSDARAPTAHASTHEHGGGDEVAQTAAAANAIPKAQAGGTLAAGWVDDIAHGSRGGGALHDAATGSAAGFMSAADKTKLDAVDAGAEANQQINANTGLTGGGSGDTVNLAADIGTGVGQVAAGNDTRIPTQDQNDALDGTDGTPSSSNPYVTDSDSRLTLAAHASTHENGGSDEINVAGLSGELADSQPAKAHAIGGTKHTASLLADLNSKISDATLDDIDDPRQDIELRNGTGSGLVSGGAMSPTGGVNFSIAAGSGFVNDGSETVLVEWASPLTGAALYAGDNYVSVTKTGTVAVDTTWQGSGKIPVGFIYADPTVSVIIGLGLIPKCVGAFDDLVHLWVKEAVGGLVSEGCVVTEKASPDLLEVDLSAGVVFSQLKRFPIAAGGTLTKMYLSTDLDWALDTSDPNHVDTARWNDISQPASTALVAMTSGYWKKDIIVLTPSTQTLFYVRGQAEYATEEEAIAAPLPTIPEAAISAGGVYLATITAQEGDTTIANRIHDIRPVFARVFGFGATAGGTAVDHQATINRGLDDAHSQYQLVSQKDAANGYAGLDGSSKLTGSQQVYGSASDTACEGDDSRLSDARAPTSHAASHENGGGDELSVAGLSGALADAQTPTAHSASHQHGGADEVATATPAANAIPKAGAGGDLAGGWLPYGSIASTACEGNDSRLSDARTPTSHSASHENGGGDEISVAGLSGELADDQPPKSHAASHQHGGTDEVATATPGANAIPKADGSGKLNGWVDHTALASAAPADVTKAAAAVGVGITAARVDHKHDVTTAAPGATGVATASGEGAATTLARSDHSHQSNTAPVNVTKSAAVIGTSGQPARANHKHDVSTAAPTTAIGTTTANSEGTATTLARSDHSHDVNVGNTQVTSVTNFSTSSATDVLITGMSITPGAGTYLALFSGQVTGNGGPKLGWFSIYANGVQQAHSERAAKDVDRLGSSTQAVVTVADGQAIEARGRGDDTLLVDERSLIVVRLS